MQVRPKLKFRWGSELFERLLYIYIYIYIYIYKEIQIKKCRIKQCSMLIWQSKFLYLLCHNIIESVFFCFCCSASCILLNMYTNIIMGRCYNENPTGSRVVYFFIIIRVPINLNQRFFPIQPDPHINIYTSTPGAQCWDFCLWLTRTL